MLKEGLGKDSTEASLQIRSTERFFASVSDEMDRIGPPPSSGNWPSFRGTAYWTAATEVVRLLHPESVRAAEILSPKSFAMGDCGESEVLITAL